MPVRACLPHKTFWSPDSNSLHETPRITISLSKAVLQVDCTHYPRAQMIDSWCYPEKHLNVFLRWPGILDILLENSILPKYSGTRYCHPIFLVVVSNMNIGAPKEYVSALSEKRPLDLIFVRWILTDMALSSVAFLAMFIKSRPIIIISALSPLFLNLTRKRHHG